MTVLTLPASILTRLAARLVPVPLARSLASNLGQRARSRRDKFRGSERQLLIDVSVITHHDARTGIQRVVRGLLMQLAASLPSGYCIRPIYATRYRNYRYAKNFSLFPNPAALADTTVVARPGDVFIGLDLAAHVLPRHLAQLLAWKLKGVELHVFVYDLLPLMRPEWFSAVAPDHFQRWIRTLAIVADSTICISENSKTELSTWLATRFGLDGQRFPISTIPLGTDLAGSQPSQGLPAGVEHLLNQLRARPTILMVGTLEPRKGYAQALTAFELLWRRRQDVNLVIVGKPGWKTDALQQRLRNHSEYEHRMWWLENASDELLERLYRQADGVLACSEGEGLGLPLIEAIRFNKPVLARDIPVFREAKSPHLSFFSGFGPDDLASSLSQWITTLAKAPLSDPNDLKLPTWEDSARHLLTCLGIEPERQHQPRSNMLLSAGAP